jgi:tryptophanyl-tRNA synthetase
VEKLREMRIYHLQFRQRREEFAKDPAEVMKLLQKGTEAAREVAANTLAEVKRAMGILYF